MHHFPKTYCSARLDSLVSPSEASAIRSLNFKCFAHTSQKLALARSVADAFHCIFWWESYDFLLTNIWPWISHGHKYLSMNSRLTELPNRCINHVATTSSIQPNDWTAHVLRNVVVDYRELNQSVISLSVTNYPSTWFKIFQNQYLLGQINCCYLLPSCMWGEAFQAYSPSQQRLSQSKIGVFPGHPHFPYSTDDPVSKFL